MAKIVLAWEYGSGFGHVAMLVPLALKLREAGHEPILVLRDIRTAANLWKDTNLAVIQAPYIPLPQSWDKTIRTDTLADVFQLGGLINARKLTALARAWQQKLAAIKPDLVVCEFSPTLALATLGVIPTITIGTGFSMPPTGQNLPSIRFWDTSVSEASIRHERALELAISETRKALGLAPVAFFSDLFGGEKSFVCVLPELDCYHAYRKEPAIGPLTAASLPLFDSASASLHNVPKAFAYLAGGEGNLPVIFQNIQDSGIPCDGYIRNFDIATLPATMRNIQLHAAPQSLTALLPSRTLLIHHGGMSTADIALRLGVPQLVLSRHLEQKSNGALLMQAGVAALLMAHNEQDIRRLKNTLAHMAPHKELLLTARKKAEEIAARPFRPAVDIVAEACCSFL